MKSKLLMLTLVLVALSIATPAFGAACNTFSTLDTVISAGSCTIGSVTFSGFAYSNASGSPIAASAVTFTAGGTGAAGNFAGFAVSTIGGWQTPFTLTYSVACASCTFNNSEANANIQPTFGGGGMTLTYTDAGGVLTLSVTPNGDQVHALSGSSSSVSNVLNAGGASDRLQALQNNFFIQANPTGVPEPTSLLLFGSGFLAVGLVARARRNKA